jgi:fatty-acyl-CoA synthase
MHSHPDIPEAALIPLPDPKWGEVRRAVVVLKPGASLAEANLTDWQRDRMTHYRAPSSVVCVDTLPKTVSKEVDRHDLTESSGL